MNENLNRSIGTIGLSANIINIIVGAGIFALPAVIAAKMGAASIIAYLFCGVLVLLIMLCYAEAGSKLPKTGGSYTYIQTAFGAYPGYLAGIFSIGVTLFADAAVSNALINVLSTLHPLLENEWIRGGLLVILFGGLAMVNVFGIKQGMRLVKINTFLKLMPLLLLILVGWQAIEWENIRISSTPELSELGLTSLILFFAFQGCETGIIVGGEVRSPRTTIPRAIFISIFGVLLLYMAIQTTAQGVLGDALVSFKEVPLAETAEVVLGDIGYTILFAGAAVSMFGYMSGSLLNSPRVAYALARDKVIDWEFLRKIHPKFNSPYLAILLYASIGCIIAITGRFEQLAIIASSALLLVYFGVALAVVKLRYDKHTSNDHFKVWGGPIVPLLSMGIIGYFLSHLKQEEIIGTVIFTAVISLLYGILQWLKKRQKKNR